MIVFRDELKAVAIPAAVLVIAGIAASISQKFPTTLGNFGVFGPYAVLVIGTGQARLRVTNRVGQVHLGFRCMVGVSGFSLHGRCIRRFLFGRGGCIRRFLFHE